MLNGGLGIQNTSSIDFGLIKVRSVKYLVKYLDMILIKGLERENLLDFGPIKGVKLLRN